MKEIICISGDLYSGKSSIGEKVSKKLGYEYFSTGKLFRSIAENMGLNVIELNNACWNHPEVDKLIDSNIKEMGEHKNKLVLDSRMAWHFVKECFKVHLTIDINEAANRALKDSRGPTEKYGCFKEALDGIKLRKETEVKRYMSIYKVDINCMENYDLVINTTHKNVDEILEIIVSEYNKYLSQEIA